MILLFNKPFNVLCQFTDQNGRDTLKNFIPYKDLYPAGRLDIDSEGLVLLTDDGHLQHLISHPKHKLEKVYWAQVEGQPDPRALSRLCEGVELNDGVTAPARVSVIEPPPIWPRTPPIRYRANIPTSWLELAIREGRNRQVRRMTAAVGHPTLRLIRIAIGPWQLGDLLPGTYREVALNLEVLPDYWSKVLQQLPRAKPSRKRQRNKMPGSKKKPNRSR